MMAAPVGHTKTPYKFGGSKISPDERAARALEHIAHYLDRIDSHLERIASGEANEKLRLEMESLVEALKAQNQ